VRLVNLTPHPVVLVVSQDHHLHIPPSGQIARCEVTRPSVRIIDLEADGQRVQAPIWITRFGRLTGLPEPQEGTLYIASSLAAQAAWAAGRRDVVVPDDLVRDAEGRVVGCRGFSMQE
jgi:hypothetical protein